MNKMIKMNSFCMSHYFTKVILQYLQNEFILYVSLFYKSNFTKWTKWIHFDCYIWNLILQNDKNEQNEFSEELADSESVKNFQNFTILWGSRNKGLTSPLLWYTLKILKYSYCDSRFCSFCAFCKITFVK